MNFGSRGHSFLAKDKVFFMGQPVSVVAAEDIHTAEEALKLIEVKYKVLPPVVDVLEAIKPNAPIIQHVGESASEMSMHNADAADRSEEDLEDIGDSDIREAAEIAAEAHVHGEVKYRNVASHIVFKQGDIAKGFAESDVVVEKTYSKIGRASCRERV